VADIIVSRREKVPFLSIHEIARIAGVSVASVSRLARRIGYAGFSEMKIDLARDSGGPLDRMYRAIRPDDSDEQVVRQVFLGNIRSLEDTLRMCETGVLVKAAKTLAAARRIIFIGIGGSGNVARDAALRFSHLDIQAEAYTDFYQILIQALRAKPGEVVFGISHSGRSHVTIEGINLARSNGAVTMGISNYPGSPLGTSCEMFFCTSFPENRVKVAALSSRIAQLCLIDALYLLTARYKKKLWDIERLNILTERLIREGG
jgi:DNA-binding MurR/RpiR family transcriptional regulator